MKRMMSWLVAFFAWLWSFVRRRRLPIFRGERVPEPPESFAARVVYLVGEDVPWSAAMLCPCGCGAKIQLSLLPDDTPSWRAEEHADGTVTLWPSVWRTKGCRSHFFVRRGQIQWCGQVTAA